MPRLKILLVLSLAVTLLPRTKADNRLTPAVEAPRLVPASDKETHGELEVYHATSNRSPCVVRRAKTTLTIPPRSKHDNLRSQRQQRPIILPVSGQQQNVGSTTPAVIRISSNPIKQTRFAESRSQISGLMGVQLQTDPHFVAPRPVPPVPSRNAVHSAQTSGSTGFVYIGDLRDVAINPPTPIGSQSPVTAQVRVEDQSSEVFVPTPVDSESDNYVAELNALVIDQTPLYGQAPWILSRGEIVDLEPGQPEPVGSSATYVNELQSLVSGQYPQNREILVGYPHGRGQQQSVEASPSAPAATYTIEKTQPFHDSPGLNSVDSLFAPIGFVAASGQSTAPPEVPKGDTKMVLQRPENCTDCEYERASSYMAEGMPSYYLTTGYGVRRAPRNTHKFYHNPLYFEDANLERCGRSNGCLTTLGSAVHFTTMAALLPYQMTADHPRDCVAALPDCPTCHSFGPDAYFPEWSWKAAAVQGAAVTGLFFVIP